MIDLSDFSDKGFLLFHVSVAPWALITNAAFLVATYNDVSVGSSRWISLTIFGASILFLLSSFYALKHVDKQRKILKLHGYVLLVCSVLALAFGLMRATSALQGVRFSWIPGILTAVSAYSAYLIRRTFVGERRPWLVTKMPQIAISVAAPFDLFILWRMFERVLSL